MFKEMTETDEAAIVSTLAAVFLAFQVHRNGVTYTLEGSQKIVNDCLDLSERAISIAKKRYEKKRPR